jgi:hypothetical protein
MSLWGNKDSFSSGLTGTITIDLSTEVVTGSGTTFVTAGISAGDILVIGVGATYGQAVIAGVTSATQLSIGSTQFITGIGTVGFGATVGVAYTVTQKPKYTLQDGQYFAPDVKANRFSAVFGVGTTEATVAAGTTVGGKNAAYAVAHAGWVGVTTYVDNHGNFRVKSETLVAGSSITGDADDDSRYPDS